MKPQKKRGGRGGKGFPPRKIDFIFICGFPNRVSDRESKRVSDRE